MQMANTMNAIDCKTKQLTVLLHVPTPMCVSCGWIVNFDLTPVDQFLKPRNTLSEYANDCNFQKSQSVLGIKW